MTKQVISTGSSANDGTGDTLRSAGTKINANFTEIYTAIGADGSNLSTEITIQDSAVVFEGGNADAYETFLRATEPTADRMVYLPNDDGTLLISGKLNSDQLTKLNLPKEGYGFA